MNKARKYANDSAANILYTHAKHDENVCLKFTQGSFCRAREGLVEYRSAAAQVEDSWKWLLTSNFHLSIDVPVAIKGCLFSFGLTYVKSFSRQT